MIKNGQERIATIGRRKNSVTRGTYDHADQKTAKAEPIKNSPTRASVA